MTDYTYENSGFNKFLTKNSSKEEVLEDESSLNLTPVAGSETKSGITASQDGRMYIDWINKKLIINDGVRDRIIIGYFKEQKKYGVQVVDSAGVKQLDETY